MIRFLIKGLLRDKSRSMFPVLTVSAGVFLTVFFYCFMQGVIGDFVRSSARFNAGHVKIMTRAYNELSDQLPNDLAILGAGELLSEMRAAEDKMIWTPRIRFGGLLDIPDEKGETRAQSPVMGLGVDLMGKDTPETEILNLRKSLVRGSMPQGKNEILISEDFAGRLGIDIGERATLISSTMYGGMAVYNFKVAGMVRFGMVALDRSTVIADIEDVRSALDMSDGASEILGFTPNMMYDEEEMAELVKDFNGEFSREEDEFSPVMLSLSEQGGFGEYFNMAQSLGSIIILVFMFAMSIVLWNSGLLNSLRRYGEIGVRLAMGEPKGALYRRTIAESVAIGIIGSVIGTVLGLAISYYLEHVGMDFSSMMKTSSVLLPNVYRARVTATGYIIGFIPGVLASVIGTMFAGIGIYRRQTAQLFKELEV